MGCRACAAHAFQHRPEDTFIHFRGRLRAVGDGPPLLIVAVKAAEGFRH